MEESFFTDKGIVNKGVLFTADQIAGRVKDIATNISLDYNGKDLVLLVVLKGAHVFGTDLSRQLDTHHTIQFIRASSYLGGTESTGDVAIAATTDLDIEGKHVLIIEDILDSGLTISRLTKKLLETGKPASVESCVLLTKPTMLKHPEAVARYVGFELNPPKFVIGYGLDFDEYFRHLPYIAEAAVVATSLSL